MKHADKQNSTIQLSETVPKHILTYFSSKQKRLFRKGVSKDGTKTTKRAYTTWKFTRHQSKKKNVEIPMHTFRIFVTIRFNSQGINQKT